MKIIFKLPENNVVTFSLNITTVMDNVETEVQTRYFVFKLRRKNGRFDPKYSIILNTRTSPQSYTTNTVALADDDNN